MTIIKHNDSYTLCLLSFFFSFSIETTFCHLNISQ
jgi:hypothetical protein